MKVADAQALKAGYGPDETEFMAFGSCAGMDPTIWTTDTAHGATSLRGSVVIGGQKTKKADQIEMARLICRFCPVLDKCCQHVTRYPEPEGVWAGTLPEERGSL